MMNQKITIRPEEHKDYKSIVSLILRSFQEGTDYSDGTDIIALVEEIRDSKYGTGKTIGICCIFCWRTKRYCILSERNGCIFVAILI